MSVMDRLVVARARRPIWVTPVVILIRAVLTGLLLLWLGAPIWAAFLGAVVVTEGVGA